MLDSQIRRKALDLQHSYIVQAPAGSGKTELITQRYLKILSVSIMPENIFCLTFTNKAIAELKERVIYFLQLAQNNQLPPQKYQHINYKLAKDALKQDKKYNWNLLENQHRIKILTIDSISNMIVNKYPQNYNFTNQNIIDSFKAQKLYELAVQKILITTNNDCVDDVIILLKYFNNSSNKFISNISSLLAKRDKWVLKLFNLNKINLQQIKKCSDNIIKHHLQQLTKAAKKNLNSKFFELCNINDKFYHLKTVPNNLEQWLDLKNLCLTKSNVVRKKINKNHGFNVELKAEKNEFLNIINNFSQNFINLLTTLNIMPIDSTDNKLLKSIVKILFIANNNLLTIFKKEQVIDFIGIALNANETLCENNENINDISLVLDYKIKHLLIDEFQDTSYLQLSIIEKIVQNWQKNDDKTLFLVGDPMQSIYRFRGADVGVFLQVKKNGIKNIKLISLTLTNNFRSDASIVNINNKIFTAIFPTIDDIDIGAIKYSVATTINNINNTPIDIYPFAYGEQNQEIEKIIDIIKANQTAQIAILYASSSHVKELIILLQKNNIIIEAVNNISLKKHIFTKDLLALTAAIMHLGDRLAWFSVLRAPWCGLLLNDLLVLSINKEQTIYGQLHNNDKLSKDGYLRANHIFAAFKDSIDNLHSFDFSKILLNVIKHLNITTTMGEVEQDILNKFLKIIDKCEQNNELTIENIKLHLSNMYTQSINSNIKIMSIHQAKGLEFDIVIIPAIGRGKKHDDLELIKISEFSNYGLLLASQSQQTYTYLKNIDKQRASFEYMRTLYVAMTRARHHIYLLGSSNKNNKAAKNTFLELLWPIYNNLWHNKKAVKDDKNITQIPPKLLRFKKLTAITNNCNLIKHSIKKNTLNVDDKIIGVILHKLYQLEHFNPAKNYLKNTLISAGISNINYAYSYIADTLINNQQNANFKWIFNARKSTLTEVEFITNNQTIIIDRLFIDHNVLWIIDFKTAKQQGNKDDFIKLQQQKYTKQLNNYKNILQNIYTMPIQSVLFLSSINKFIKI